jgi:IS605 OrfB family transposase
MISTFQTRFIIDEKADEILEKFAYLFSTVERKLYSEVASGKKTASCKNRFLKQYGLTARQFNACRVSLDGKLAAYRTGQMQRLDSLKQHIELLKKEIPKLEKKPSKRFATHQKKRRLAKLISNLSKLENDVKTDRTHLCFGGKKLFLAQFNLKQNGFASQKEWKKAWEASRNNEFFTLGSKDEAAGNQTCTATINSDGSFNLRLRLPTALESKYGKYLLIKNVSFAYGQKALLANLNDPDGQAISYRFKKDAKGWRVLASTSLQKVEPISCENIGAIGIDLNADHIACVETDRFGNPINKKNFPWICYGKSKAQTQALTGDICKEIVDWAKEVKKPIIVEKLDFQKRRLNLRENKAKMARLLSSFAYGSFFQFINARAYKNGITLHQVNPAFTSVIGRVNYAERYGLSVHLAAALCIARRHQKFSESPCLSKGIIPDGKGSHVAFFLPARNRKEHVWRFWGKVKKKIKTVLAAHFRAICNRSLGPPLAPVTGNSRKLLV